MLGLLGLVVLLAGPAFLAAKILRTMALAPGSDRLASWLEPPVQVYISKHQREQHKKNLVK